MTTLILAGQSQAERLSTLSGIATLSATLNSLTNKSVSVRQAAVGGSALLKAAAQTSVPTLYWLNKADVGSPLRMLTDNFPSDAAGVAWWHGEQDASVGVAPEAYAAGMVELQAILAGAAGKAPKDFPLVLCYLGNAQRLYPNGWKVRKAQNMLLEYPGFIAGPECVDLSVDPADNIHLDAPSREIAAARIAQAAAPVIGVAPVGSVFTGSLTRDISLASGPQTISSIPFTPSRVDFSALIPGTSFTSGGTDNVTAASCSYTDGATGGARTDASVYIFAASSGNGYKGRVSAFQANGFVVDWTRIGAAAGSITVNFTAHA